MWKSSLELDAESRSLPDLQQLATLYALSVFWKQSVFCDGYKASSDWTSILKLSQAGQKVLDGLSPMLDDLPGPDVRLALFSGFYHHDLFFDYQNTDSSRIRELLEKEIFEERVRLPHRFGRTLYDRFNDTYTDSRTDHLMSEDVGRLLQGTPTGVYQLGTLVSGPLGIVVSQERRYLPPILDLPLWHCSDTGCKHLHDVTLVRSKVAVLETYSRIRKTLFDRVGPPAEWGEVLARLLRGEPPRVYADLPALVADCIVGEELACLLEQALVGEQGTLLRGVLSEPPRKKRDGEGPARDIASRLAPEARLQLLLVFSDKDLVALIDGAVISRTLRIPLGEVREIDYKTPRHSSDSDSQLSALGIRSVRWQPIVNLTRAIWRAYQNLALTNELSWRVRGGEDSPLYDALVMFIRKRGPAEAARELILSSARITEAVYDDLKVPLKYAKGTDEETVNRLLWKLGFNPMQFDDWITRFKFRLSEFKDVTLTNTPINTEDARDRVRAAGVNVFVSLEDFLDRLISYNIWLLSSDHFTNGKYSSPSGRRAVSQVFGGSLQSGALQVSWDVLGVNPLGTLLRYLRAAADWVQGLPARDRKAVQRADRDLPHFADSDYLKFPFRHIALWADSDPVELQKHAELFARITKLIEESDPASVRNGLDHFRDPDQFPPADKLLACAVRLGQALDLADTHRFVPKVHWLFERRGNRFGVAESEFRDYAGRVVVAYGPQLSSGLEPLSYDGAHLVAPGNLLGIPNSTLVFQFQEPSAFSKYWEDYPRRRAIPGANSKQAETPNNSAKPPDALTATQDSGVASGKSPSI